jgi:hypothetical protein
MELRDVRERMQIVAGFGFVLCEHRSKLGSIEVLIDAFSTERFVDKG